MARTDTQHGGASVEFALTMVLLLSPLLAGAFDVARFLMAGQTLSRAAREGVILASRNQDPVPAVRAAVAAGGLEANRTQVQVVNETEPPTAGTQVQVDVIYSLSQFSVLPWEEMVPEGLRLTARARRE